MCLLNKTTEYIILFLLILSKNIFGTYGSSGPPSILSKDDYTITTTQAPKETNVANESDWVDTLVLVLKASIMISIIVAAVFGNLLVIISRLF